MRTTYVKHNKSRKPEFALQTSFEQLGSKITVVKTAYTEEGSAFIKEFTTKYETLRKLGLPFSIEPPVIKGNRAEFVFVNGDNLFFKMKSAVVAGREKEFTELFHFYLQEVINPIPTTDRYDARVEEIFGNSLKLSGKMFTHGLVDLNFDNFVVNGDVISFIDYEWLFDFSIPVDFVVFRALFYFFQNLQNSRAQNLKIVKTLLHKYMRPDYLIAEYKLQKYINTNIGMTEEEYVQNFNKLGKLNLFEPRHDELQHLRNQTIRAKQQESIIADLQAQLTKVQEDNQHWQELFDRRDVRIALKLLSKRRKK